MFDDGDVLLFVLSAWRETSWKSFKKAFDELYRRRFQREQGHGMEDASFYRRRALRSLVALAHVDVSFDEQGGTVAVAPALLAALPRTDTRRAILCGTRSPGLVGILHNACSRVGGTATLHSQDVEAPYTPVRVEVQAPTDEKLEQIAGYLQIRYERIPPCWTIAEFSGSLRDYLTSLRWVEAPELNWQREDFDPETIRFRRPQGMTVSGLRLSRYLDPTRLIRRYFLHREGASAAVHPEWGRYAVLESLGRAVLHYDTHARHLLVPSAAPLPPLLQRALVLCSGYASTRVLDARSAVGACDVFGAVPPEISSLVAGKLGQTAG